MNILIVVAHPDDEIIGIGGSAIKHVQGGDDVYVLILGKGAAYRDDADMEAINRLEQQTKNAGNIIGFEEIFSYDFPDNGFDSVSRLEIIKIVEKYIKKIKPSIVYTHYENDVNIDHQMTFQAVMTACRPIFSDCPKKIYTFETLSSTEWQLTENQTFSPNTFINIEKYIDKKLAALEKYKDELCLYPHSRSLKGVKLLSQYRGLQSGIKYAEGLVLKREIL
ncbi:MAG: PIG-L family deacetylase [Desulfobacula sp.]|jgi:LmbE family N-acetylglucosaminyl deacetylase|nr:PIG-L family deacetylase [Desulfobacula sp.]